MRIVVQNLETGQYLQGPDKWTSERKKAMEFDSAERAARLAVQLKLLNAVVLYEFDDEAENIRVPVGQFSTEFEGR
jgi:hypothetical protein